MQSSPVSVVSESKSAAMAQTRNISEGPVHMTESGPAFCMVGVVNGR